MMQVTQSNGFRPFLFAMLVAGALAVRLGAAEPAASPEPGSESSCLAVVWTSADPEVAHRVCLMYTHAAARNN